MTDQEAQMITGELRGLADEVAELRRDAANQASYAVQLAERNEIRVAQVEESKGLKPESLFAWAMIAVFVGMVIGLAVLGLWQLAT